LERSLPLGWLALYLLDALTIVVGIQTTAMPVAMTAVTLATVTASIKTAAVVVSMMGLAAPQTTVYPKNTAVEAASDRAGIGRIMATTQDLDNPAAEKCSRLLAARTDRS
jgi:hypothetical protein